MDAIADPAGLPGSLDALASTLAHPGRTSQVRRRTWLGLGIGLGLGLVFSAHSFSTIGYRMFPDVLTFNLTWWPALGMIAGYGVTRPGHVGRFYRRWLPLPRFRMWALMLLVAYMAVVCGLGEATRRVGRVAKLAHQRFTTAQMYAEIYGTLLRSSGLDAALARANVEGLRNGKYPEGLMAGQAAFLKSLEVDPKVTPEYRAYRRGRILQGWEERAAREGHNADMFAPLTDHHAQLAAKYDRITKQPWLPMTPDPPEPPSP